MWNAKLVRGNVYYYGSKRFENGKAVTVDDETKEYLEKNAVDHLSDTEGNPIDRPKFEFEEIKKADDGGDDDAGEADAKSGGRRRKK